MFLILLSTYLLENTGRNIIFCVKMLLLRKVACANFENFEILLKLKCKAQEIK